MKGTVRTFFHDNITNMGEVRACVYFFVISLCFQISIAKPFFFGNAILCDLFCEPDDDSTTTSSEDLIDDWCNYCFPNRPRTTTTLVPPGFNPGIMQSPPFNVMIPPANGMNITMVQSPNNGWWNMNLNPWPSAPAAPSGAAAAPSGAPVSPPATTPAAAAAAATTAAATTAAPTTAAAGK